MTDGPSLSLRRYLDGEDVEGEAAEHALWWPPAKVAGRYLAPYLHGREEAELLGLSHWAPHIAVHRALEPPAIGHASGQAGIELLGIDRARSPTADRSS